MALPTIYWFSKMGDYIARVVPFVASVLAFFAWAYNIVAVLFVLAFNAIKAGIASLDTSFMQTADFSAFYYIGLVNAIFPLSESLALLGAYYTFWIAVIGIRWVKSFIPTVSN